MAAKRKSKGVYMISAVAEMYEIHPQTLRLYEREGLLKPSRSEGNTRLVRFSPTLPASFASSSLNWTVVIMLVWGSDFR